VPPPFDARAIANFILDEADALNIAVYPTSLLKILYFGHGWHLAQFDTPLVAQPFEAWEHGPVVRVVYDQISADTGRSIKSRLRTFNPRTLEKVAASAAVGPATAQLLRAVIGAYGVFHPYKLSDLTHVEDSPWTEAWESANAGLSPGAKIPNRTIHEYFLRQNYADVVGLG
jgi:uncharacterized phage-associated protein